MNRVERINYDPGPTLAVDYDRMGRPTSFDDGTQRVVVDYGATGAVRRLSVPAIGESLDLDGQPPPGVRPLSVRRLAALSRDALGLAHPHYGPVRFAETTFYALPLDAAEAGVPHLTAARDLFAVALPLFGGTFDWIVKHFEKPSNPVFQPAEYRSTNCCVAYGSSECNPFGPINYGGGGSPSFATIAESVDQCMRNADARISAVTPHTVRYDPPRAKGWKPSELGAATRCGSGYCTHLNEDEIKKDANYDGDSLRTEQDVIHEVLAHEYAHHILDSGVEGGTHDRLTGQLRHRTRGCH